MYKLNEGTRCALWINSILCKGGKLLAKRKQILTWSIPLFVIRPERERERYPTLEGGNSKKKRLNFSVERWPFDVEQTENGRRQKQDVDADGGVRNQLGAELDKELHVTHVLFGGFVLAQGGNDAFHGGVRNRLDDGPRRHHRDQADDGAQQGEAQHLVRRPDDGIRRFDGRPADRAHLVADPASHLQTHRRAQNDGSVFLGRGEFRARVEQHQRHRRRDEQSRSGGVSQEERIESVDQRQEDGQE